MLRLNNKMNKMDFIEDLIDFNKSPNLHALMNKQFIVTI